MTSIHGTHDEEIGTWENDAENSARAREIFRLQQLGIDTTVDDSVIRNAAILFRNTETGGRVTAREKRTVLRDLKHRGLLLTGDFNRMDKIETDKYFNEIGKYIFRQAQKIGYSLSEADAA